MGQERSEEFRGVRARLQRHKDYRFFHGWVTDFNQQWLVLRMSEHRVLAPGDTFTVEVHGRQRVAKFEAEFRDVDGVDYYKYGGFHRMSTASKSIVDAFEQDYEFVLSSVVHFGSTTEEYQIAVDNVAAILHLRTGDVDALVIDASESKTSIETDQEFEMGSKFELTIMATIGSIKLSGSVMAVMPSRSNDKLNRVSVAIQPMSRIDGARWRAFMGMGQAA